jgi:transposase
MRKQKSAAEFGFDRYDRRRLQKALSRVTNKRTFLRLKAVLLVAEGKDISTIAKLFDRSVQVIYHWVNRYLSQHQPLVLFDALRSGRPTVAELLTETIMLEILEENPLHLGYRTTVWTVAVLAMHLGNHYGISITPRTLRRRMKQVGLRFKRPRYVYSEKDPNRAQKKGRLSES